MAWSLMRRGVQVTVADVPLPGRSSVFAAGIINPVTGRRFVKSWRYDELYPVAKRVYAELEQELGVHLWEDRPVVRLLASPEECNDWATRCAQEGYEAYLGELQRLENWEKVLKPGFRFGITRHAARVNLTLLLEVFQKKAREEGWFQNETIEYAPSLTERYDRVVFCEGWRGADNPLFPEAPFELSKGEALLFRIKGAPADFEPLEMLKKTLLVAPLGDGLFWAGSTYHKGDRNPDPSPEGRSYLLGHLEGMFSAPIEVQGHIAGVRPTMRDRRPFLMQSRIDPKAFMLNGLGTKGALLAPYFAESLVGGVLGLELEKFRG
jgi:glycine/D-amino acid oxidase-like deaminating enzyme